MENVLRGILEREDGGAFGKDVKASIDSLHKGPHCGVVISSGKEDDGIKEHGCCF